MTVVEQEMFFRVEHRLRTVENVRQNMPRWKREDLLFKSTLLDMQELALKECVTKLLPHARDRHFLLILKRRYSSGQCHTHQSKYVCSFV